MKWTGKPARLSLVRLSSGFLLSVVVAISPIQSATIASAAEPVDLIALREVLCAQETGTCGPKNKKCPVRAWAFDQKSWSSVGYCQIHLSNAFDAGYSKTKDPALLFQQKESEKLADDFLVTVQTFLIRRGARPSVYNMAFKYNCGINRKIERKSDPEDRKTAKGQDCADYAERVVTAYNERIKEKKNG